MPKPKRVIKKPSIKDLRPTDFGAVSRDEIRLVHHLAGKGDRFALILLEDIVNNRKRKLSKEGQEYFEYLLNRAMHNARNREYEISKNKL